MQNIGGTSMEGRFLYLSPEKPACQAILSRHSFNEGGSSKERRLEHSHNPRRPDTGQRGIEVTQISNMFG